MFPVSIWRKAPDKLPSNLLLVPAGTTQAEATAIPTDAQVVFIQNTVNNAGVKLPRAEINKQILIVVLTPSVATTKVYPQPGETIFGASVNSPAQLGGVHTVEVTFRWAIGIPSSSGANWAILAAPNDTGGGVVQLNNTLNLANAQITSSLRMSGAVVYSTVAVAAAGTGQSDAASMQSVVDIYQVTSGTGGIKLPACDPTQQFIKRVINRSGVSINIYPQSGSQIDALGANNPFILPNNSSAWFGQETTSRWYSYGVTAGYSPLTPGADATFANATQVSSQWTDIGSGAGGAAVKLPTGTPTGYDIILRNTDSSSKTVFSGDNGAGTIAGKAAGVGFAMQPKMTMQCIHLGSEVWVCQYWAFLDGVNNQVLFDAGSGMRVNGGLTVGTGNLGVGTLATIDSSGNATFQGSLVAKPTRTSQTTNLAIGQPSAASFSAFDNAGATGEVDFTLPSNSTAGAIYHFIVKAAQTFKIIANTGQTIRIGASVSSSAGSATASIVGTTLVLMGNGAGWDAIAGINVANWTLA